MEDNIEYGVIQKSLCELREISLLIEQKQDEWVDTVLEDSDEEYIKSLDKANERIKFAINDLANAIFIQIKNGNYSF